MGGTLDTTPLEVGSYWIVEAIVPTGFTGSDPILVDLNLDSTVTCVWDSLGLVECVENDGDVEALSWTIVEVENTPVDPSASPSSSVLGETGTPNITLPPTDTATSGIDSAANQSWRLVILAMAGLMAAALLLTPARLIVGKDGRRR